MSISSIGGFNPVFNPYRTQQSSSSGQVNSASAAQQQMSAVSDPDHDGDTDGAGPDIDGKGQTVDYRA